MSVIDGELLRSIVGGYDNDCFWKCISYINSGASSYSEADAEDYAKSYFGPNVNLDTRKNGAAMTDDQMSQYISQNYGSSTIYKIVQFDPGKAPNVTGGSMAHAVIYQSESKDSNGNKVTKVFDPQQGKYYEIPSNAVMNTFNVGCPNGIISGGSSSSSSSSSSGSSGGSGSSSYYH